MHSKYLSSSLPILADGDFMGFYFAHDDTTSSFPSLVSGIIAEGQDRKEKIIVGEGIFHLLSETEQAIVSFDKCFYEDQNILSFEEHLANLRTEGLAGGYSGIRYLTSGEKFSLCSGSGAGHHDEIIVLKNLLRYLMKGGASLGVFYFESDARAFLNCSRHPRIYYNRQVFTNPLFVRPETLRPGESELQGYLAKSLQSKKSDSNSEPFPAGIPNMLESIVDSMGLGVVVGDLYGNMVLLNRAAQGIMELPPSPLPYAERVRRFGNFLPDEKTPYPFDDLPLSRAVRGEPFDNELVVIKRDGMSSAKYISSTGRPVKDSYGNLIGGVLVFRDVTQEKQIEKDKEALEYSLLNTQKLESLGMLAGGIAHDFNNLLVGVLGNASMLLQQKLVYQEGVARLEQIQNSALALSELTRQLLVYAGLSPMKDLQKINICKILSSMRGIAETGISKKVTVNWDIPDEPLFVEGDEVQIKQLFLNFLTNASDAHEKKSGRIDVIVSRKYMKDSDFRSIVFNTRMLSGWYVSLKVSDTGNGISQESLDKIFDPFFSTKGVGRGLGLSAAIGIIKNHRGALKLQSVESKGTTFEVLFPLIEVRCEDVQEHSISYYNKKDSGLILVIDDEPMVLDVADAILTHAGYNVTRAESGKKGIELFKKYQSSIVSVVLDMTMPDVSGEYVYSEIRKLSPKTPVLMASGFSKEICSFGNPGDAYFHYLSKPYSSEALLGAIRAISN
ncbi:MAG TPA: ATP-binding protein [Oligoflexia bacterium]|nr:ATP-binding protein [Oligoflexia bacterium]HMP48806.1 ATP-binding protein [Oligoflexia bacterium]